MLYGCSDLGEAQDIKKILDSYSKAFGQEINPAKSKVFIFNTQASYKIAFVVF